MKLLIYTPRITHRIHYTFSLFFEHLGLLDYEITSDAEIFEIENLAILNYSNQKFDKGIHFPPSELLTESGIVDRELKFTSDGELSGGFPHSKKRICYFRYLRLSILFHYSIRRILPTFKRSI